MNQHPISDFSGEYRVIPERAALRIRGLAPKFSASAVFFGVLTIVAMYIFGYMVLPPGNLVTAIVSTVGALAGLALIWSGFLVFKLASVAHAGYVEWRAVGKMYRKLELAWVAALIIPAWLLILPLFMGSATFEQLYLPLAAVIPLIGTGIGLFSTRRFVRLAQPVPPNYR